MKYSIEAHNVSKQYYLGALHKPRTKTKEFLTSLAAEPFNRLRAVIQGRSATYNDTEFWALRDVSFQLQTGECLGVIGRNGSGKSTLLKILSNVVRPTKGYTITRGKVATMLEVGAAINLEMTGRENIFLSGVMLGMSREDVKRNFDEIVAFAELEEFLDTPMKRYSSGMTMRLAFSVGVHLKPEILIIDEVLAVGDIGFMEKSLNKVQEIINDGTTVVLVSHLPQFVEALCTTAIWLDKGQIRMDGDPLEVAKAYQEATTTKSLQEQLATPNLATVAV